MKVACEQLVRDGAASWTVVRPRADRRPRDPTGRFTYWPARLRGRWGAGRRYARDPMQVIDIATSRLGRDLRRDHPGDFGRVGEVLPLGELLATPGVGLGLR